MKKNYAVHYKVLKALSFETPTAVIKIPKDTLLRSPSVNHEYFWYRTDSDNHKLKKDKYETDSDGIIVTRLAHMEDTQVGKIFTDLRNKGKLYTFTCPTKLGKHPLLDSSIYVENFNKQIVISRKPLSVADQCKTIEALEQVDEWLESIKTVVEIKVKGESKTIESDTIYNLSRMVKILTKRNKHDTRLPDMIEALDEAKDWRKDIVKAEAVYGNEKVSGIVVAKKLKRPKKNGKYTGKNFYEVSVRIPKSEKHAAANAWFMMGQTAYNGKQDEITEEVEDFKHPIKRDKLQQKVQRCLNNPWYDDKPKEQTPTEKLDGLSFKEAIESLQNKYN